MHQLLKSTMELADETHNAAKNLVQHQLFELGDASVAAVCGRKIVVLTADVQLQVVLGALGLDAINFNRVRASGWRRSNS